MYLFLLMGKPLYKRPCFFILGQNVCDFFHLHACILRALLKKCVWAVHVQFSADVCVPYSFWRASSCAGCPVSCISAACLYPEKQDSVKEQNTWFSIIHEHLISIKHKCLFPLHFQIYRKKEMMQLYLYYIWTSHTVHYSLISVANFIHPLRKQISADIFQLGFVR